MRIKCWHVISSLETAGAEMALYRLLARMDPERFENQVACLIEIGAIGEQIRALGIPVRSLQMRRGWPSPAGIIRLSRLLRRGRPDLVQTWLYHANLLGLLAARLVGLKNILWNVRSSDMDMTRYRWLSGWTVRVCARFSGWPRAVVVNSEAGRAYHARIGYHPRQWVLIPNGVDPEEFHPDPGARESVRDELGLPSDALLIGLVARFDPMKDHGTFFRAAARLLEGHPGVHFVLAGDGVTAQNRTFVSEISGPKLTARTHLLSRRSDIPRITAALDIATCSSLSEGFPNVIAEAMACGVPCVVTDAGDAAGIVGDSGVVVPRRDPERLAEGWRRLVEGGAELRQRMGQAARLRMVGKYNLGDFVRRYEDLYLSVASPW